MDNIFFAWTSPRQDWLIGLQNEPDNKVTDGWTGEESTCDIISIGFLFFRIDIVTTTKGE